MVIFARGYKISRKDTIQKHNTELTNEHKVGTAYKSNFISILFGSQKLPFSASKALDNCNIIYTSIASVE